MSRRSALATATAIAVPVGVVVTPRPDPVLAFANRCSHAVQTMQLAGDYDQVQVTPEAERRFREHEELVMQMVETPAASIAGIRAKLQEVFGCELNDPEPSLNAWTLQHVMDDLERLARRA
jgi:hypothetical protein